MWDTRSMVELASPGQDITPMELAQAQSRRARTNERPALAGLS